LAADLRQPGDSETVAMLVADRHDNVGMDSVTRAIGDAGGATILFDAGDDTSTGEPWEAFSLDSLAKAYDDYDAKYAVAGNHDNGKFVGEYLGDLGFTVLTGDPVKGSDGIRLLGAPDPRSSNLGSGRTEGAISIETLGENLADAACASDDDGERISTMIVHDPDVGSASLQRGCVDLVLAGHQHIQEGPTQVTGANGKIGTAYTNGTSGGAAYAFALGSKIRRDAEVTLVTYRDGRAVGLQPVTIKTSGEYVVAPFIDLPGPDPAGG
ncbi:MAG: metallophosphoesterase, partial [Nocardioidaceae bacterium]